MSRKVLPVKHHLCSGCCMWSGIEDVYATKTNQTLPEAFLFGISSFGESVYFKTKDKSRPFMLSVADGRTRKTYGKIKDILGLTYQISEGHTLSYALKSVKAEIDKGHPVVLGPLDMFYLPYLKMYHHDHIPMHYILMIGYDEEKKCVLIYDCDRPDLIELPEQDLIDAWQIEKNAVGDKNGFIRFTLSDPLFDKYELTDICLKEKAARQLCEKPDFIGINAFSKVAKDFLSWKDAFYKEEYRHVLASLTESFGMVPKLPNEILGICEPDISFKGNYDRLGTMLCELGNEYAREDWSKAGALFHQCGILLETITGHIIQYYCNQKDRLSEIPDLFLQIGQRAKQAYEILARP
ncbi:MAG: hypothetical protein E7256_05715 [Lachnospiraceae bacterium]|nr:hypothetical protein [Lachnospiraceae bacterium]